MPGVHKRRKTPSGERLVWADGAKALCIVLVVLQHVVQWADDSAYFGTQGQALQSWQELSRFFAPLRMPLFFILSGYFASSRVRHLSWRDVLSTSVAPRYYLYLVWMTLGALFYLFGPTSAQAERLHSPEYFIQDLFDYTWASLVGFTDAWYFYALAAYFLVTRALFHLSHRWAWMISVLLSLMVLWLPNRGNTVPLLANLPFFALGALHPSAIDRLAAIRATQLVWSGFGLFVLAGLASLLPSSSVTGAGLLLGLASIVGVVPFLTYLARRFPATAMRMAQLGKRTLEIYVLHLPLRSILLGSLLSDGRVASWPYGIRIVLEITFPVLATAGLVFLSLQLRSVLEYLRQGWLFVPPWLHRQRYSHLHASGNG